MGKSVSYKALSIFIGLLLSLTFSAIAQNQKVKVSDRNGQKLFMQEEYEKAIYVYKHLLMEDEENTFFRYIIGVCYFKLGDNNDLALSNLAKSVEGEGSFQNSSPPDAHYFYGRSLHIDKQYEKAIAALLRYREFVMEDYRYEARQIQEHYGGEENAKSNDKYYEELEKDPILGQINVVLDKIDAEIETIKVEQSYTTSGVKN